MQKQKLKARKSIMKYQILQKKIVTRAIITKKNAHANNKNSITEKTPKN